MNHRLFVLLLSVFVMFAVSGWAADKPVAEPDTLHFDQMPAPLTPLMPEYPASALHDSIEGTVHLETVVGADGRTKNVRILAGARADLNAAAIAAVQHVRWSPAISHGQPVEATVVVPLRFKISPKAR